MQFRVAFVFIVTFAVSAAKSPFVTTFGVSSCHFCCCYTCEPIERKNTLKRFQKFASVLLCLLQDRKCLCVCESESDLILLTGFFFTLVICFSFWLSVYCSPDNISFVGFGIVSLLKSKMLL